MAKKKKISHLNLAKLLEETKLPKSLFWYDMNGQKLFNVYSMEGSPSITYMACLCNSQRSKPFNYDDDSFGRGINLDCTRYGIAFNLENLYMSDAKKSIKAGIKEMQRIIEV